MDWQERLRNFGLLPVGSASFEPLDDGDVSRIESAFGATLPEAYRAFLTTYGESVINADLIFPTAGGGILPGVFFGRRIVEEARSMDERLPPRVVPINDDGGGNLICISLRDDTYGAVMFQNHNVGPDPDHPDADQALMDTFYVMAPSFREFVLGLERDES